MRLILSSGARAPTKRPKILINVFADCIKSILGIDASGIEIRNTMETKIKKMKLNLRAVYADMLFTLLLMEQWPDVDVKHILVDESIYEYSTMQHSPVLSVIKISICYNGSRFFIDSSSSDFYFHSIISDF